MASGPGISSGYGLDGPDFERWRFALLLRVQTGPGVHSTSYKNEYRGVKAAEHRLATLLLPSAVAVNMWTLASTSLMGLHGL